MARMVASPDDVIELGGRLVGANAPPFMIAEVGVNHDGSVETAHDLIDAAAACGADAAKFQTFSAALVAHDTADTVAYQRAAGYSDGQLEMLRSLELPTEAWGELRSHCLDAGLSFVSTAFDAPSLELVCSLDPAFLKIPSGEFTNRSYVTAVAGHGLPVVASTGMCTVEEVDATTGLLAAAGVRFALLHCVTAYPAPLAEANLLAVETLLERYRCPVGWSDHTTGHAAAIIARVVGASIFERHLTLDRSRTGPDHAASSEPDEFAEYVRVVRDVDAALGTGEKRPTASEIDSVASVRRGHYAARPLAAGSVLAADDLVQLRPVLGVPASEDLVGRRTARDLAEGEAVEHDVLVPES